MFGAKKCQADKKENQGIEDVLYQLRSEYPNGHSDFIPLALEEIKLHSAKNHDYTGGVGSALGNFRRIAAILDLYPGLDLGDPTVNAIVQMFKQLDAYLWSKSEGYSLEVEPVADRLRDVAVYAKLISILEKEAADEEDEFDDEDEEESA